MHYLHTLDITDLNLPVTSYIQKAIKLDQFTHTLTISLSAVCKAVTSSGSIARKELEQLSLAYSRCACLFFTSMQAVIDVCMEPSNKNYIIMHAETILIAYHII